MTGLPRKLTDEERMVAYSWARWVLGTILDACDDAGVERVDDDRFADITCDVLRDIAESNTVRVSPQATKGDTET